jgi:hypothetical protein
MALRVIWLPAAIACFLSEADINSGGSQHLQRNGERRLRLPARSVPNAGRCNGRARATHLQLLAQADGGVAINPHPGDHLEGRDRNRPPWPAACIPVVPRFA